MFSLRTLLRAVVVVAIGVVGLTTRNIWWASAVSMLTWMSIAVALIVGLVSRDRSRWFSVGFAVGAAFYLFVVFSRLFQPFAGALVTNRVVVATWQTIDVPQPQPQPGTGLVIGAENGIENVALLPYMADDTDESREYYNQLRSFYVVAHCLWAWLFGSLGALLAGYLARQTPSRETNVLSQPPD